jgi:hypothetical protein
MKLTRAVVESAYKRWNKEGRHTEDDIEKNIDLVMAVHKLGSYRVAARRAGIVSGRAISMVQRFIALASRDAVLRAPKPDGDPEALDPRERNPPPDQYGYLGIPLPRRHEISVPLVEA